MRVVDLTNEQIKNLENFGIKYTPPLFENITTHDLHNPLPPIKKLTVHDIRAVQNNTNRPRPFKYVVLGNGELIIANAWSELIPLEAVEVEALMYSYIHTTQSFEINGKQHKSGVHNNDLIIFDSDGIQPQWKKVAVKHPEIAGLKPVVMAGDVYVVNGEIVGHHPCGLYGVDNWTGHYLCNGKDQATIVKHIFRNNGFKEADFRDRVFDEDCSKLLKQPKIINRHIPVTDHRPVPIKSTTVLTWNDYMITPRNVEIQSRVDRFFDFKDSVPSVYSDPVSDFANVFFRNQRNTGGLFQATKVSSVKQFFSRNLNWSTLSQTAAGIFIPLGGYNYFKRSEEAFPDSSFIDHLNDAVMLTAVNGHVIGELTGGLVRAVKTPWILLPITALSVTGMLPDVKNNFDWAWSKINSSHYDNHEMSEWEKVVNCLDDGNIMGPFYGLSREAIIKNLSPSEFISLNPENLGGYHWQKLGQWINNIFDFIPDMYFKIFSKPKPNQIIKVPEVNLGSFPFLHHPTIPIYQNNSLGYIPVLNSSNTFYENFRTISYCNNSLTDTIKFWPGYFSQTTLIQQTNSLYFNPILINGRAIAPPIYTASFQAPEKSFTNNLNYGLVSEKESSQDTNINYVIESTQWNQAPTIPKPIDISKTKPVEIPVIKHPDPIPKWMNGLEIVGSLGGAWVASYKFVLSWTSLGIGAALLAGFEIFNYWKRNREEKKWRRRERNSRRVEAQCQVVDNDLEKAVESAHKAMELAQKYLNEKDPIQKQALYEEFRTSYEDAYKINKSQQEINGKRIREEIHIDSHNVRLRTRNHCRSIQHYYDDNLSVLDKLDFTLISGLSYEDLKSRANSETNPDKQNLIKHYLVVTLLDKISPLLKNNTTENNKEALGYIEATQFYVQNDTQLFSLKGQTYLALNELAQAAKCFEKSVELDNSNIAAHVGKITTDLASQVKSLQEIFQDIQIVKSLLLKMNPDNNEVYLNSKKQVDLLLEKVNKKTSEEYKALIQQGKLAEAEALILQNQNLSKNDHLICLFETAQTNLNDKKYDAAMHCFNKLLEIDSKNVTAQCGVYTIELRENKRELSSILQDIQIIENKINSELESLKLQLNAAMEASSDQNKINDLKKQISDKEIDQKNIQNIISEANHYTESYIAVLVNDNKHSEAVEFCQKSLLIDSDKVLLTNRIEECRIAKIKYKINLYANIGVRVFGIADSLINIFKSFRNNSVPIYAPSPDTSKILPPNILFWSKASKVTNSEFKKIVLHDEEISAKKNLKFSNQITTNYSKNKKVILLSEESKYKNDVNNKCIINKM